MIFIISFDGLRVGNCYETKLRFFSSCQERNEFFLGLLFFLFATYDGLRVVRYFVLNYSSLPIFCSGRAAKLTFDLSKFGSADFAMRNPERVSHISRMHIRRRLFWLPSFSRFLLLLRLESLTYYFS